MSHRDPMVVTNPLLKERTPAVRGLVVLVLITAGFVGLGARAAYVQWYKNEYFLKQGEIRFQRKLELPANRGRILDRNGQILASSVPVPSIWAIPEDVEADAGRLRSLATLLEIPLPELKKKLADDDKNFVWLKRQVSDEVAKQVSALDIKGVYTRKEYMRQYPDGESIAHIVGMTNADDKGSVGIEAYFDKQLAGTKGSREVIKDRFGRVVQDIREHVPPTDGKDITLSVDSRIQFFAYQKLRDAVHLHKARAGSVVVIDAVTGEVLALANYPSFSPANRRNLTHEQLRNSAISDTFEPGSTMKPFTVGLALDSGRVSPKTVFNTAPGSINITGSTLRDAHPHGALTVEEIIKVSSNVGTIKMAMDLPSKDLWETYSQAGFGQKPQVEFPGAAPGRLRPYKTWRPVEKATMSYGYGLSASLFQMARSYTVFAHDGQIIPATFLKRDEPAVGVPVFSAKTAAAMRKMLQMAAGPGGTGPQAQTVGYSVGGKSGTAYKQVGKSYATNRYRSWFNGLAPIDKPRIVVAVMIDEPTAGKHYGGEVAGPVFGEIVQQSLRLMGVPPDLSVKPQTVAQAVEESF